MRKKMHSLFEYSHSPYVNTRWYESWHGEKGNMRLDDGTIIKSSEPCDMVLVAESETERVWAWVPCGSQMTQGIIDKVLIDKNNEQFELVPELQSEFKKP